MMSLLVSLFVALLHYFCSFVAVFHIFVVEECSSRNDGCAYIVLTYIVNSIRGLLFFVFEIVAEPFDVARFR